MYKLQPVKREIQILGFNSIYYFEFGKDFSHIPEKHNFWEMVYVDSGEIIAVTNGVGCTLSCGQAIFHEPGEIHAHISNNRVPNNMLVIAFSTQSKEMDFFKQKTFTLDKNAKTLLSLFVSEAKNALGDIPNNYSDKDNLCFDNVPFGSAQLLECYLTEFLIKLMRSDSAFGEKIVLNSESRMIAEYSISELVKSFMADNIYSNITLGDLCTHFMLGKSQLSKIFKENCGESPMSYYMRLKICEAKKLLRENVQVGDIAERLGYADIYSFSKAFKKVAGIPPTTYKKTII